MKIDLKKLFMGFSLGVFSFLGMVFLLYKMYLPAIVVIVLAFLVSRKIKVKRFWILLLVVSFLIRLAAIVVFNFPQTTDFKLMYECALKFVNHDFSWNSTAYFMMWPYQSGFVVYEGLLLKLINNIYFLKVLNIIYESLLVVLIYYFSRRFVKDESARVAAILFMVYPYNIYLGTTLANHHIATILSYLGIVFLLSRKKKPYYFIAAGILIGLSNVLRPEGIIIIFSYLLFMIFNLKKDNFKKEVLGFLILLVSYGGVNLICSNLIILSGVNNDGLKNTNPLWKFVLGFNGDSCGYYDSNDEVYINNKEKELEIIKERLNPSNVGRLVLCKTNRMWLSNKIDVKDSSYDKAYYIGNIKIKFNDLANVVSLTNHYIFLFVMVMMILGVFRNRKDIINNESLFFLIMVVVAYFVFLLIEIQPRYLYLIHPSIFILSAYGIEEVMKKIKLKK
ncbi:MAG: glycosyltransferase family 39 protein [Bacilli bacterium]|nr:glycosyltransferase family 39 protein [Bacilli bacterium]